jgi:hypothetical protein
VNRSAGVISLVPYGVVTVTSTVLAGRDGAVAVIEPASLTMNDVLVPPNETSFAPVKLAPVIVTLVV